MKETDSRSKSRLAQVAFVLAWLAALQWFLHFCPALAVEWDTATTGTMGFPIILCVALTGGSMLCGVLAAIQVMKSNGVLKGLGFAIAASGVGLILILWMFSSLVALSRHKALQRTAWVLPG